MDRKYYYLLYSILVLCVGCRVQGELVAHWEFEDGPGSMTAADSSVNNNIGTLVNLDAFTDWTTGHVGTYSLDFDGIEDYVNCGNDSSFNITDEITVAAWVKPANVTSYQLIVSKRQTAHVNVPFDLHLSSNNARLLIHDGTNNDAAQSSGGITAGNWHHVAAVYDGANIIVYADGVAGSPVTRTAAIPVNTNNVVVGRRADGAFDHFTGTIDDVRIYSRALSAAEIIALAERREPNFVELTVNTEPAIVNTVTPLKGVHIVEQNTQISLSAERFISCPDVMAIDHWEGDVSDAGSGSTTILMDMDKTVTAVYIDDSTCGDECHPLPLADMDGNCEVNLVDFAVVAQYWQQSTLETVPEPDALTPFSLVALPDTQYYSASYPDIFNAQMQWIKDNRDERNIVFVLHEGDIVNTVNVDLEWQRANASISILDGFVPYTLAAGNHDIDHHGDGFRDIETTQRDSTKYNQYFPYTRYENEPWYGGHMGSDNDNHYVFFSAGGMDFMIITMEAWPTSAMLVWANQIVSENSVKRVIFLTHDYLDTDDTISGRDMYMWNDFVKNHDNIFLTLNGHLAWGDDGLGRLTSTGVNGNQVHQIAANYQDPPYTIYGNGGNGWLRIMKFIPGNNRIEVTTYSPWLDQFATDGQNQFDLVYMMICDELLPGDLNTDCTVNIEDIAITAESWMASSI